jgi:hypothetical protein
MKSFLFILFAIVIQAKLEQKSLVNFVESRDEIMNSAVPKNKKSLEEQVYDTWGSKALDHLSS